jgi:hypothetical protein
MPKPRAAVMFPDEKRLSRLPRAKLLRIAPTDDPPASTLDALCARLPPDLQRDLLDLVRKAVDRGRR